MFFNSVSVSEKRHFIWSQSAGSTVNVDLFSEFCIKSGGALNSFMPPRQSKQEAPRFWINNLFQLTCINWFATVTCLFLSLHPSSFLYCHLHTVYSALLRSAFFYFLPFSPFRLKPHSCIKSLKSAVCVAPAHKPLITVSFKTKTKQMKVFADTL